MTHAALHTVTVTDAERSLCVTVTVWPICAFLWPRPTKRRAHLISAEVSRAVNEISHGTQQNNHFWLKESELTRHHVLSFVQWCIFTFLTTSFISDQTNRIRISIFVTYIFLLFLYLLLMHKCLYTVYILWVKSSRYYNVFSDRFVVNQSVCRQQIPISSGVISAIKTTSPGLFINSVHLIFWKRVQLERNDKKVYYTIEKCSRFWKPKPSIWIISMLIKYINYTIISHTCNTFKLFFAKIFK